MRFLMLVAAPARRLTSTTWATESAFVEHLRQLRNLLQPRFNEFVIAMPEMSEREYQAARALLTAVDETTDGFRFEPTFQTSWSNAQFVLHAPAMLARLRRLVRNADLIHGGISGNVYRPAELAATLFGAAMHKKIIGVTDMDNRHSAEMGYRAGLVSRRELLKRRWIYDPLIDLQQRLYVRLCDQVLFKEAQQVADYGAGSPHVRLFLDPNFALDQIATDEHIHHKERALADPRIPLRVLYFGRFVPYKGVDRMIDAVARAREQGARLTFDLMGSGVEETALKARTRARGIEDITTFLDPIPYGERFFHTVREHDVMLACPLLADTPRSAWDSLAAGVPLLAFDTPFYRSIASITGAVLTSPWPEVEPFAAMLTRLAADRKQLAPLARKAAAAARSNTGDAWLERRAQWIGELFEPVGSAASSPTASIS